MAIFLDTGFFLGLLHEKDSHHEECKNKFLTLSTGKYGLLFTSTLVVSECSTLILIQTKKHTATLKEFYEMIYGDSRFVHLIRPDSHIDSITRKIFLSHNESAKKKKEYLSYVDASNIAICQERNINNIISTDGDFASYLNCL